MKENKIEKYKVGIIMTFSITITFLLTLLGAYAFFITGTQGGKYVFVNKNENNSEIAEELDDYRALIEKYYLGDVDEEKLKEGAIAGYISGLDDPYSEYIPKSEMKSYMENVEGNFVGIGIYMSKDNKTDLIKVASIIKGSPAEKYGLKAGDLIKTVDGIGYTVKDFDTISSKIKGEEGSTVKLEILRKEEELEIDIVRERVIVNRVESKIYEKNVGYIKISSFDETTGNEFKENYEKIKGNGAKSLIIDLRNNGGGLVDEALKIADYIVEKDKVLLYQVDKNGKEKVTKSENEPIVNMPIIVLVNENSASSSEILAGTLKDLGKAKIVGKTTYGKGVIQSILRITDGSALKLTVEEYLTPNRNKIHKKGIKPDEEVELPDTVESILSVKEEEDTQLKRAIEILK